eukprot:gb/GEZN01012133.1/.p1 GENE.gb/GEZN01012133.1/~~gb/GEZN01012133.1/.p1  ORF type:complete len:347 (+),score=34.62 gb/GEZN01012133.1/:22-1041(+)
MSSSHLNAVAVLELDQNQDIFSWSFPNFPNEDVVRKRCGLEDQDWTPKFRFSKMGDTWQYMQTATVSSDKKGKHLVEAVCIVVLSTVFNPEKFQALCKLLTKLYLESHATQPVLQAYLSVQIKGAIKTTVGEFKETLYPDQRAILSPVKHIFDLFGVEAILIWVAVLLKKRILVYSGDIAQLNSFTRSLPLLGAFHRKNWGLLRPYITMSTEELEDLKTTGVYIAGTKDSSAATKKNLYDIYVDIPSRSFNIPDHAKEAFKMTKYHKTTAETLLKVATSGSDSDTIKAIDAKTKELFAKIKSLGDDLSLKKLETLSLPPNMPSFLYNVAAAEGFLKNSE